jgi:hypothetical protein
MSHTTWWCARIIRMNIIAQHKQAKIMIIS